MTSKLLIDDMTQLIGIGTVKNKKVRNKCRNCRVKNYCRNWMMEQASSWYGQNVGTKPQSFCPNRVFFNKKITH